MEEAPEQAASVGVKDTLKPGYYTCIVMLQLCVWVDSCFQESLQADPENKDSERVCAAKQ